MVWKNNESSKSFEWGSQKSLKKRKKKICETQTRSLKNWTERGCYDIETLSKTWVSWNQRIKNRSSRLVKDPRGKRQKFWREGKKYIKQENKPDHLSQTLFSWDSPSVVCGQEIEKLIQTCLLTDWNTKQSYWQSHCAGEITKIK